MPTRRGLVLAIAVLAFAMTGGKAATAQTYPSRPITIIVPFSAGGTTDVIARILGEHMSRTLGQQLIVENVVGAGGTTGSVRAMRASPDGYTLELGNMGTHAASVALYPSLAYNPEIDFAPIGLVAGLPVVIVGKKELPPNDLKEFASYVKANAEFAPARSRPMQSAPARAMRRCHRCRHRSKPGLRNSRRRPGTRCLRPKERPSRSSTR